MKIVIVDNDRDYLRSLELALLAAGHEVDVFSQASSAVLYLTGGAGRALDGLLFDYVMPEMNGAEFWRSVQGQLSRSCRAALVSGFLDIMTPEDVAGLPLVRRMAKPIDLEELLGFLRDGEVA